MAISLGDAINSVTEDEKWVTKVLIGGFITIPAAIAGMGMHAQSLSTGMKVFCIILYLLFGSLLTGFLLSSGNKMLNTDSNTMGEWFEKDIILKGLKFIFSYFVYWIVMTVIYTVLSLVCILVCGLILGSIYYLINLLLNIDAKLISYIIGVVFGTFIILLSLYLMQFVNAALVCYYKNLKFGDLMALKKQYNIVMENKHAAWTLVGKEILFGLLFGLVILVLAITIVGIFLLPFVYFAAYVIMVNLYAQYGREIKIGKCL